MDVLCVLVILYTELFRSVITYLLVTTSSVFGMCLCLGDSWRQDDGVRRCSKQVGLQLHVGFTASGSLKLVK